MPSKFFEGDIQGALERAVEAELTAFGEDVRAAVVAYLDEQGINVDGQLSRSVTHEVSREVDDIVVSIGPTAHYGLYRHEGTRPHWAPIAPLRDWVRKKLGIQATKTEEDVAFVTKSGELVNFRAKVNLQEKVARALQRKIAKEGTEGDPYLAVPFNLFRGTLAKRVGKRIEATLGGAA